MSEPRVRRIDARPASPEVQEYRELVKLAQSPLPENPDEAARELVRLCRLRTRPALLRSWVRALVGARESALTLVFESFAFKQGVPLDADYVFDVRVLPNPHYIRELRPLTGRDAPVAAYLEAQPDVREMLEQIETFLRRWLAAFEEDQRSYLTVAIGCTGGQHRSVYIVEQLARRFAERGATLAMRFADEAIIVTNPEVSSVRDSDRVLGLLSSKTDRAEKGEGGVKAHLLLRTIACTVVVAVCALLLL